MAKTFGMTHNNRVAALVSSLSNKGVYWIYFGGVTLWHLSYTHYFPVKHNHKTQFHLRKGRKTSSPQKTEDPIFLLHIFDGKEKCKLALSEYVCIFPLSPAAFLRVETARFVSLRFGKRNTFKTNMSLLGIVLLLFLSLDLCYNMSAKKGIRIEYHFTTWPSRVKTTLDAKPTL